MTRRVIVAPLNWGLGHATRCIPVTETLLAQGAEVIIASNGNSLSLLRKQFPSLQAFHLPGFNPSYPSSGSMAGAMMRQLPKFLYQIEREKAAIAKLARQTKADSVISDNRYGARTSFTRNIFISHQLNIQVPEELRHYQNLINRLQAAYINRFDECWIPDIAAETNLSGDLARADKIKIPFFFAGILSALKGNQAAEKKYDIVAILSGPEPQRSIFEGLLIDQLATGRYMAMVIRGRVNDPQPMLQRGAVEFMNYADGNTIANLLHKEAIVIARSGYTTIMDLAICKNKAILIPTPGQTEQEYLAAYLSKGNYIVSQQQPAFNLSEAMEKVRTVSEMSFTDTDMLTPLVERLLKS